MKTERDYSQAYERNLAKAWNLVYHPNFSSNVKMRLLEEKLRQWAITLKSAAGQIKAFGYVKYPHPKRY